MLVPQLVGTLARRQAAMLEPLVETLARLPAVTPMEPRAEMLARLLVVTRPALRLAKQVPLLAETPVEPRAVTLAAMLEELRVGT